MEWLFCVLLGATVVSGYPGGPPVGENPEICSGDMEPKHNAEPKTTPCPFKIVVKDNCYKAGGLVPISIEKVSAESYFEGFMLLARESNMNNTAVGTFSTKGDGEMQTLKCFNKADSAIGHKGEKHYTSKNFLWKAPADYKSDVVFQATIVKKKADNWLGVKAPVLSYKADCENTGTEPTNSAPISYAAAGVSICLAFCTVLLNR